MMRKIFLISMLMFLSVRVVIAATGKTVSAYRLTYQEKESGIDPYKTEFIVTNRYLRINDLSEKDGFILYDDKTRTIYSVSDYDKRTLVMKYSKYKPIALNKLVDVSYLPLKKAPKISGHSVYRYKITVHGQKNKVCADIQVAKNLLPQVTRILHRYKEVLASNQVKDLYRTPGEFKTACYIADQVYDSGEYYLKGLPIMESHSNDKHRSLLNYEKVKVNPDVFVLPAGYQKFSLPSFHK